MTSVEGACEQLTIWRAPGSTVDTRHGTFGYRLWLEMERDRLKTASPMRRLKILKRESCHGQQLALFEEVAHEDNSAG